MFYEQLVFGHLALCLFMTGLIWVIQLVHYPSFLWVDKNQFREFVTFHGRQISFIVLPIMVAELVSAAALIYLQPGQLWTLLNGAGVAAIWLVTVFMSIPCHARLSEGFDAPTIHRLITTNWLRTLLWTLRSVALAYLVVTG